MCVCSPAHRALSASTSYRRERRGGEGKEKEEEIRKRRREEERKRVSLRLAKGSKKAVPQNIAFPLPLVCLPVRLIPFRIRTRRAPPAAGPKACPRSPRGA